MLRRKKKRKNMRGNGVLMLLTGTAIILLTMTSSKGKSAVGSGSYPNPGGKTRGLKNNNPGNIRLSGTKYLGEITGPDTAFKAFSTMAHGYRAIFVLLDSYKRRHGLTTIQGIISRYAPTNENNTAAYVAFVAGRVGVGPASTLIYSQAQFTSLVSAISRMENGVEPVPGEVAAGYQLFVNQPA